MRHFWYIVRHKWFVMIECFKVGLIWEGIVHDLDKFRIEYFVAYNKYQKRKLFKAQQPEELYPKTGDRGINREILRHRKTSPHHWQYYCYGRKQPSPMPDKYIKEMICDWVGAAKARGRKNLMEWYSEAKDYMIFNEETKGKVDTMLNKFINK
ncbi:MAG: hypothetical protein BWY21_01861 [Parcubacteria group bacterium ADurb.Bin216]|jgi:hypothetical protein|nr:MAG: hypothetical protein BWY21_01861 [Parcubacteria group bacterium ADurb.Bin216]